MRVTFLGQAGLYIETEHGTILCDPWFNTAFFASWFPFPSNEDVDIEAISRPDYLYVSHLHHDHFDPDFLRDHVDKDAVVLLPEFPIDQLERELQGLGFRRFVKTRSAEPVEVDELRVMIMALVAPTDGPIGDSGLAVDDGRTLIFNQNDSRPVDLEPLRAFGPLDGHFLQFSGAIWYPMVYDFPLRMKQTLGRKKRQNEMARAKRYAEELGASFVFPSAGPPCFLDPELFDLNDFDRDPTNVFPDQTVFLEYLREHGMDNGRLLLPGTVATLEDGRCDVRHPSEDAVEAIFGDKRAYLEFYQARMLPEIERRKAGWPRGQVDDLIGALKQWWQPLLAQADVTCAGINGRVLLEVLDAAIGDEQIVIDFLDRRVDAWKGEPVRYRFRIPRPLVETCVLRHDEDWVNELFLSCRFEASRHGPFNEYVYNWFKGLSPERLQYAEGWYAEQAPVQELIQLDGFLVQRRCPHLKADLAQFGVVEDGVLTCRMHGWQFDLATGRCLTSDDRRLHSIPADQAAERAAEK
ncbi:MAG TPA: MBL fold metallo-hydrolase [Actinomycetes bacterium]|jgi:UDP-MurNAc hydroxylase|nr:MBL fold metallo-hydrolase [Actinomycetes bacterium]